MLNGEQYIGKDSVIDAGFVIIKVFCRIKLQLVYLPRSFAKEGKRKLRNKTVENVYKDITL